MTTELRDGVWQIKLRALPGWIINSYLVDDDGTLTLIDAGMPWNASDIRAGVEDAGYDLEHLERVLITHYDLDHFGGLLRLSDLDIEVYAGRPDAGFFTGDEKPPLLHHKGAFHRLLRVVTPDLEVEPLEDGDDVGGFQAFHTPGHNPGHMAYVNEAR
ncbi:MAG: MBL fold metallo-hydrolase, partial [Halobacteria archaeon]|nr:MBL fold metallo-hydrolase [Halobacteria archaeon]